MNQRRARILAPFAAAGLLALASGMNATLGQSDEGNGPSLCDAFSGDALVELLGARYEAESAFDTCTLSIDAPPFISAAWQTGDLETSKQFWDPGEDVLVGGRPAWLATDFGTLLIGFDNGVVVLTMAAFGPGQEDPGATLLQLGELLVASAPSLGGQAAPEPSDAGGTDEGGTSHVDPELEALFPSSVGGQSLSIESMPVETFSSDEARQQIEDALATQGKSIADMTFGVAFTPDFATNIFAIRVDGGDAEALAGPLVSMQAADMDAEVSTTEVAGKPVTVLTSSAGSQYAYASGEVLWIVQAMEPALSEIMAQLP